jgi:hypothetical protein
MDHANTCYDIDIKYTTDGMVDGTIILDKDLFTKIFGTTDVTKTLNPGKDLPKVEIPKIKPEAKKDMTETTYVQKQAEIVVSEPVKITNADVIMDKIDYHKSEVSFHQQKVDELESELNELKNQWLVLSKLATRFGWNA